MTRKFWIRPSNRLLCVYIYVSSHSNSNVLLINKNFISCQPLTFFADNKFQRVSSVDCGATLLGKNSLCYWCWSRVNTVKHWVWRGVWTLVLIEMKICLEGEEVWLNRGYWWSNSQHHNSRTGMNPTEIVLVIFQRSESRCDPTEVSRVCK